MVFSSKGLAFLLALCISVITTSFLSLVQGIDKLALFVTFALSFSSAYLLGYIILEFLIFREISQINETFENFKDKNKLSGEKETDNPLSPFRQMKQELFSFAENKQREIEELRRLETFRREFLADVSHELKTPIFAAQGFVHTLMDGAVKDKSVRDKFLKKAAKSLDGLDELVHDLIIISQMESGEITMHPEDFNIYDLTSEIIDQIEEKAAKKNISIDFGKKGKETFVIADPRRIHQVLTNLISNALKYTESEGKVKVQFRREGEEIVISISDTGIGIPEGHQLRIFERFYRIDKSRSKVKGGSGLGLAIVKHIIEAHGSQIFLQSEENIGSTFSFKLKAGKKAEKQMQLDLPQLS